jgi:REP element-mobilizing transposase RayT
MIGTYASWLPGDERGFRNRGHRIHSSGDYRHPPPTEEHQGLRRYNVARAGKMVKIPLTERKRLAAVIACLLTESGCRVLVVSVSMCHAHVLAEMPLDLPAFDKLVGRVKTKSSRALKDVLPGRVWSRGDKHILVDSDAQLDEEYDYIRNRQGKWARSWCAGEPFA